MKRGERPPEHGQGSRFSLDVTAWLRNGRDTLKRVRDDSIEPIWHELLYHERQISERLKPRLQGLAEAGILEKVGKGRGARFILSRYFYQFLGTPGLYTRRRGLDRGTNKELLWRHLSVCQESGCQMRELMQVLPQLSREEVKRLLNELRQEGRAHLLGRTKGGRWYPGPAELAQ